MLRSELHFLGHTIDLLTVETNYNKPFHKYKGNPDFYNEGGLLKVTFGFGENYRFLERMTTVNYELYKRGYPLDDGKIVFYDANGDSLKTWRFQDAAIVFYKVVFDSNGGGMIVEMLVSPAIQNYGAKIHRWWHETPIPEEQEYVPPIVSAEEQIIDFYYTDTESDKEAILTYNENTYLVLETKNMIGKIIDLNLKKENIEMLYQGKRLVDGMLKNYTVQTSLDKIPLQIISEESEIE